MENELFVDFILGPRVLKSRSIEANEEDLAIMPNAAGVTDGEVRMRVTGLM